MPRRFNALLAAAGLAATIVAALSLLVASEQRQRRDAGAPVQLLPMHYTGEFRYAAVVSPIWCALEVVEVRDSMIRRAIATTRPAGPAGTTRPDPGCADDAAGRSATAQPRRRRQEDPRVLVALGPGWEYEGTLGLGGRVRVYRRFRTLPVRVPSDDETVSVVNQVERPVIELDGVRLVPDDNSTMRFEGPRRVLRATSPGAKRERFAGQVAYTVPLRDLVRDPRVEIGRPTAPERSFGDRVGDSLGDAFGWMTSLLGLAIAAAVTALAGYLVIEWWKRREPRT